MHLRQLNFRDGRMAVVEGASSVAIGEKVDAFSICPLIGCCRANRNVHKRSSHLNYPTRPQLNIYRYTVNCNAMLGGLESQVSQSMIQ